MPNKAITLGLVGPWGGGLLHIAAAATLPRKREEGLPAKPLHRRFGKHGKGSEDRMARGLRTGWSIVDARIIAPLENSGL